MPVVIDGTTGITTPDLASASTVTATTIAQSATLSDGSNNTSTTNVIRGSARAWVNFVGATGVVTTSYNVSSVTRGGTGGFTVNFTNSFADANYAILGTIRQASSSSSMGMSVNPGVAPTVSAVAVVTYNAATSADPINGYVAIYR